MHIISPVFIFYELGPNYFRSWSEHRVQDMIHELIDPKKKTNKTIASRNTKTLDNKPFSDHCTFEPSDSENKEAESSSATTFIPPWLRNSLGLNQRNNQSHAAAGHSDQKSPKLIQRYKEPNQNDFDSLKTNGEEDCCKKDTDRFENLPLSCPQEENVPDSTDEVFNNADRSLPVHWAVRRRESNTDSSYANVETKTFEKEDSNMANAEIVTVAEMGKLKEEEKKKTKSIRQRNKVRRRGASGPRTFELVTNDVDPLVETNTRQPLDRHSGSEINQPEAKLMLISGRRHNVNSAKLSQREVRMLKDMKEQVGSIGDFDLLLEHVKEANLRGLIKNSDFLNDNTGGRKVGGKEDRNKKEILQICNDDRKSNADRDSLLSTDDENDIKRFSEFLSKNKNVEEKRKCLEEVRNYFEKKRKTRLSKRRHLEDVKTKLTVETDKKEKLKCKELFTITPSRGKKSKFALCDEEVVEKAVDETLQKFVEMYHFHVSPAVMGNMKKNILQAMQSDSMDSSCSKLNLFEAEGKAEDKKVKNDVLSFGYKLGQKSEIHSFINQQGQENSEFPDNELLVNKENRKKTFKTLVISSNEQLRKHPKEIDIVENERLKRLNKEFENFLHSIQNHIEVSNLKIQSIILEKDEQMGSSKQVQFVYNFTKRSQEGDSMEQWYALKETQEPKMYSEVGVQASLKRELLKKSVRIQVMHNQKTLDRSLQTEEMTWNSQATQTEGQNVPFRELKELRSLDISPGLYRMVKSKEAGKFYLYPEQLEDSKGRMYDKSNSSVLKDKKYIKKKELSNVLSKERTKERRTYFRDKEKNKLKRSKKTVHAVPHAKPTPTKKSLGKGGSGGKIVQEESSVNCLYFRDFDEQNMESPSKEMPTKKASATEVGEILGLGDVKEDEHIGCVWFWNGKKISPGCDLKTHVEDLLKEKLKELTDSDPLQTRTVTNNLNTVKNDDGLGSVSKDSPNVKKNMSTVFFFRNFGNNNKEHHHVTENDNPEGADKLETEKSEETEEGKGTRMSLSQEKLVRNVATQNSQSILSSNPKKIRTSKTAIPIPKKKHNKQTPLKPATRKLLNFKKAEEIIRAIEEIKKLKLELESVSKEDSRQSESLGGVSSSSSSSKNEINDPLCVVLGLRDGQKPDPSFNMKNRLKKVVGFADHEVQTSDLYDPEDVNSEDSRVTAPLIGSHRHLELIENVLCRVNQKERESLWNNVREFIKTKLGRDIDTEGAREVCIEIEQDMPKQEQGKTKRAVMARGHYVRNEGDVEVEIDLTLEDLERILRQRQRKIRRQHIYRRKYKKFISSSSVQSDLTKDDVRRCQKYLNRFTALGEAFETSKPSGSLKKNN